MIICESDYSETCLSGIIVRSDYDIHFAGVVKLQESDYRMGLK
jgi:hypothetical protein